MEEKSKSSLKEKTTNSVVAVKNKSSELVSKGKDKVKKSREQVVQAVDQNGDGVIDIEDIILLGLKTPGVKINREVFLRKELQKNYDEETINIAVKNTPSYAKIPLEDINKMAEEVIKYERYAVTGISTALSAPGGVAMVATVPADIAQYYGYLLRCTQKLLYLYGFPEINVEKASLDTETLNILIICLGVMYGVAGTNKALLALSRALAEGVEKKLLKTALTKTTFYPIVKSVAKWFNINMTKKIFAGAVKKSIPVAGGIIGGAFTWFTFKPCCEKLKNSLQDTLLTNPNHKSSKDEDDFVIFDVDEDGEVLDTKEDSVEE